MELLYAEEHHSCFHYEKNVSPTIERIELLNGKRYDFFNETNKFIFVLKGELTVSFNTFLDETVRENVTFFLPAKCRFCSYTENGSVILLFNLNLSFDFCSHFSFQTLLDRKKNQDTSKQLNFITLKANSILKSYMETLDGYIGHGLRCSYFMDIKQRELLFLLRAYYEKKDLNEFFTPALSQDLSFSNKVHEYYKRSLSVPELAELMNYSTSGFNKKFMRVFGISAYQWMKNNKAKNIYHDINCTQKTFSEIGYEYGFSSSSYFNDFCKTNFGKTPGAIRKMKQKMQEKF